MEVVEINTTKKQTALLPPRKSLECPCNVRVTIIQFSHLSNNPSTTPINQCCCFTYLQCTKRYVQPPRVKSFAPERKYCPPSKLLEANSTYHISYLNVDHRDMYRSRSQPIRPTPALGKFEGAFSNETTSKLSYKPVGRVPRSRPILPRQR